MLYQKGTQRIEVIVKKDSGIFGGAGAKETDADKTSAEGGENTTSSPKTGLNARQKRIIKTNLTHLFATIKQSADLGIEYYIGGIGQRNGDQALQDRISRKMESVKDVSNFASSVAMGALYGSWGGTWGTIAGMTFAAASTGASTLVKYANRRRDYDFKVFKENNAIEYTRAKYGISLTNGRLR